VFREDTLDLEAGGDESDSDPDEGDDSESGMEVAESNKSKKAKAKAPVLVPLPAKRIRTLRRTGHTAYVVFLDSSSIDRALARLQPRPWPPSEALSDDEPSGLSHFIALYDSLRPPLDAIRAHADSAMEVYEYEQEKSRQKSKYRKGEAVVDEDGFTLVTRGGAYGKTLGGGVAVASKKFHQTGQTGRKRRKEKKEKDGFYAFQKAEKQRQELLNLKKKWEEDKVKVEKLKQSRRFNPY